MAPEDLRTLSTLLDEALQLPSTRHEAGPAALQATRCASPRLRKLLQPHASRNACRAARHSGIHGGRTGRLAKRIRRRRRGRPVIDSCASSARAAWGRSGSHSAATRGDDHADAQAQRPGLGRTCSGLRRRGEDVARHRTESVAGHHERRAERGALRKAFSPPRLRAPARRLFCESAGDAPYA